MHAGMLRKKKSVIFDTQMGDILMKVFGKNQNEKINNNFKTLKTILVKNQKNSPVSLSVEDQYVISPFYQCGDEKKIFSNRLQTYDQLTVDSLDIWNASSTTSDNIPARSTSTIVSEKEEQECKSKSTQHRMASTSFESSNSNYYHSLHHHSTLPRQPSAFHRSLEAVRKWAHAPESLIRPSSSPQDISIKSKSFKVVQMMPPVKIVECFDTSVSSISAETCVCHDNWKENRDLGKGTPLTSSNVTLIDIESNFSQTCSQNKSGLFQKNYAERKSSTRSETKKDYENYTEKTVKVIEEYCPLNQTVFKQKIELSPNLWKQEPSNDKDSLESCSLDTLLVQNQQNDNPLSVLCLSAVNNMHGVAESENEITHYSSIEDSHLSIEYFSKGQAIQNKTTLSPEQNIPLNETLAFHSKEIINSKTYPSAIVLPDMVMSDSDIIKKCIAPDSIPLFNYTDSITSQKSTSESLDISTFGILNKSFRVSQCPLKLKSPKIISQCYNYLQKSKKKKNATVYISRNTKTSKIADAFLNKNEFLKSALCGNMSLIKIACNEKNNENESFQHQGWSPIQFPKPAFHLVSDNDFKDFLKNQKKIKTFYQLNETSQCLSNGQSSYYADSRTMVYPNRASQNEPMLEKDILKMKNKKNKKKKDSQISPGLSKTDGYQSKSLAQKNVEENSQIVNLHIASSSNLIRNPSNCAESKITSLLRPEPYRRICLTNIRNERNLTMDNPVESRSLKAGVVSTGEQLLYDNISVKKTINTGSSPIPETELNLLFLHKSFNMSKSKFTKGPGEMGPSRNFIVPNEITNEQTKEEVFQASNSYQESKDEMEEKILFRPSSHYGQLRYTSKTIGSGKTNENNHKQSGFQIVTEKKDVDENHKISAASLNTFKTIEIDIPESGLKDIKKSLGSLANEIKDLADVKQSDDYRNSVDNPQRKQQEQPTEQEILSILTDIRRTVSSLSLQRNFTTPQFTAHDYNLQSESRDIQQSIHQLSEVLRNSSTNTIPVKVLDAISSHMQALNQSSLNSGYPDIASILVDIRNSLRSLNEQDNAHFTINESFTPNSIMRNANIPENKSEVLKTLNEIRASIQNLSGSVLQRADPNEILSALNELKQGVADLAENEKNSDESFSSKNDSAAFMEAIEDVRMSIRTLQKSVGNRENLEREINEMRQTIATLVPPIRLKDTAKKEDWVLNEIRESLALLTKSQRNEQEKEYDKDENLDYQLPSQSATKTKSSRNPRCVDERQTSGKECRKLLHFLESLDACDNIDRGGCCLLPNQMNRFPSTSPMPPTPQFPPMQWMGQIPMPLIHPGSMMGSQFMLPTPRSIGSQPTIFNPPFSSASVNNGVIGMDFGYNQATVHPAYNPNYGKRSSQCRQRNISKLSPYRQPDEVENQELSQRRRRQETLQRDISKLSPYRQPTSVNRQSEMAQDEVENQELSQRRRRQETLQSSQCLQRDKSKLSTYCQPASVNRQSDMAQDEVENQELFQRRRRQETLQTSQCRQRDISKDEVENQELSQRRRRQETLQGSCCRKTERSINAAIRTKASNIQATVVVCQRLCPKDNLSSSCMPSSDCKKLSSDCNKIGSGLSWETSNPGKQMSNADEEKNKERKQPNFESLSVLRSVSDRRFFKRNKKRITTT